MADSGPYADWLVRPVWPKAHRTNVESHKYTGNSKQELDDEARSKTRHHHPLRGSVTGSGTGQRAAGTSGATYDDHAHPDDYHHGDDSDRQAQDDAALHDVLKQHAKNSKPINSKEREELLKTLRDAGHPDELRADFKKLLDDPSVVISARDVKSLTPDYEAMDSHKSVHGWARYTMPVSENEVKNQNWQGKAEQEAEKERQKKEKEQEAQQKDGQNGNAKDGKAGQDQKSGNQDGSDQSKDHKQEDGDNKDAKQANGEEDEQKNSQSSDKKEDADKAAKEDAEHGDPLDNLSIAEKRFMDALYEEARTIQGFKNATGEPGPAADLDGTEQMGYELQVDDQFTPDNWVPRSNHLLRLTGKHPLNAETDLRELYDAGMITPVKLHYVRNHGAVPKLEWESHKLSVFSEPPRLLASPADFSMDDLANMPALEIAVTIACDGNRRGEVNMVKRSAGFTWSSSGVSTCKWKGVLVRDVLIRCGIQTPPPGERWYLNYEGADEPSEGRYATSIPLAHAMNLQNDVLLAYAINGRPLSPDHGAPLRSIIPGYVGGRQVKWLKKLWITKQENKSHYHIWDNRVLPSFVTDKNSIEGKALFHHPSTACNDQVLQSIICRPSHGEGIPLTLKEAKDNDNIYDEEGEDPEDPLAKLYRVQGFAYNGGGNIVERVELSLDEGKTWRYCFRKFVDEPLRHGEKYWTWVQFYCDVPIRDLCQTHQICVRAFDPYKNTQPEYISWNFMGMMNNCWYRLKSHNDIDPKTKQPCITYTHPVAPGGKEGGWMKLSEAEAAREKATSGAQTTDKTFTLEEVEKHNTEKDCWIILDGKVYDATSVLSWHPGGASAIMTYAGKATASATADYNAIHDSYAQKKTQEVLIGKLSDKGIETLNEDSKRVAKKQKELAEERKKYALQPFKYFPAKLVKRKEISSDTRVYTFKLPEVDGKPGKLGLPIGRHVQIASHWKDSVVMRPYTPTRPVLPDEEDGTFDLLIKTYLPEASPFPPGGTMGNYLDVLKEGESIDINGPTGEISYLGGGNFEIEEKKYHFDKINLVAGGTGITPHWQLIHAIMKVEDDKTQVSLINSNKTVEDTLLREELQEYADKHPDQFKLWFTLSKAPEDQEWKYSVGHLDEQMMRDHFFMPEDGDKVATFLCGPPGLIKHGAMPALQKIGFEDGKTCFGF